MRIPECSTFETISEAVRCCEYLSISIKFAIAIAKINTKSGFISRKWFIAYWNDRVPLIMSIFRVSLTASFRVSWFFTIFTISIHLKISTYYIDCKAVSKLSSMYWSFLYHDIWPGYVLRESVRSCPLIISFWRWLNNSSIYLYYSKAHQILLLPIITLYSYLLLIFPPLNMFSHPLGYYLLVVFV